MTSSKLAMMALLLGSTLGLPAQAQTVPLTLGAIAATIGIGALAGYFPARRAATLPPGVALRAD